MIGIIIADSNEINPFPFEIKETKKKNQFHFTIYNNNLVVVHSGIGIVNAASAAQELISSFNVKEIINFGSVGGNNKVNLYDIITPAKIFFHDVKTPWYPIGQTPGEKKYFINSLSSDKNNNLASGSSFVIEKDVSKKIKEEIDCDIFDMEAGAIAQVAYKNNVPIKIIKFVSDSIGNQNNKKLKDLNKRIKKASKLAFEEVIKLIKATY